MFRKMRRFGQQMDAAAAMEILEKGKTGILAVLGDGGYPYAVPLNYACHDNTIFFHCAHEGHKIEALRNCNKVSFCVVDMDEVVPETLSTDYRCVIVFGRARELTDRAEIISELTRFTEKYDGNREQLAKELSETLPAVIAIDIEHITGKQAKRLAQK